MQNNICASCNIRSHRKIYKYCVACARAVDKYIPTTMTCQYTNYRRGEYISIVPHGRMGRLIFVCDQFDDIERARANLFADLGATLGQPSVFDGYEFTFNLDERFINPVVVAENDFRLVGDVGYGNIQHARVNRYKCEYTITMRKLPPAPNQPRN